MLVTGSLLLCHAHYPAWGQCRDLTVDPGHLNMSAHCQMRNYAVLTLYADMVRTYVCTGRFTRIPLDVLSRLSIFPNFVISKFDQLCSSISFVCILYGNKSETRTNNHLIRETCSALARNVINICR